MEIIRRGNGGDPQIASGSLKRVNSYNVAPTPLVATASEGTLLDSQAYKNYEFFTVTQTSAGTDVIRIPDSLPVGTELRFQATAAFSIGCPTGSSVTLNNVAAPAIAAIPINTTAVILKVSATRIVLTDITTLGAYAAIVPA